MKNTFKEKLKIRGSKFKKYVTVNKKKSIIGGVILVAVLYWATHSVLASSVPSKYMVANVVKGDVVSTISASGQVSATNQIELKSKNSGDLLSVKAVTGQEVKAGTVIAQVDAKDAWYAYQSAKIAYDKLVAPAGTVSTIQAQNSVDDAKNNKKKYEDNLSSAYADAVSDIDSTFIDMPKIIDEMNTMYYTNSGTLNSIDESSFPALARSYKLEAGANFDKARREFDTNFTLYKSHNALSSNGDTEKLTDTTYAMVSSMAQAVKGTKATLDYLQSSNSGSSVKNLSTSQTNTNNRLSQLNSHLTQLVGVKNSIKDIKNSILIAEKTITEKEASYSDLQTGPDALDLRSAQLSLQQKASAYADSYIKAPFDGIIAKVSVKKGDAISSSAVIATLVTKQKIVTVSLNEVDISKVKVGQEANVTFDAIDNFIATGTVASVDEVGVTTQGVVSYSVQVALNQDDERILSGMSASVVIDVESKKDVVAVANAAIKTQGKKSYVEVVTDARIKPGQPIEIDPSNIERRVVELGLADDDKTEIVSGLTEGEIIIVRTVAATTAAKTATTPSLFGGGAGGGNVRAGGTGGAARAISR